MGSEPEFQNLPRGNSSDRIQWRIDVLPQVKLVLSNFRRIGVNHPTIRAVYYKLYSMGAIPANELKYYKGLDRMLTDVRMEQDDDVVKPDTFADDSRIEPEEVEMETPEEYAEAWVSSIQSAHERYEPPIWYKQLKYVEVWIEKNAMYSTFQSILSDKQVVIQSSRGFNSLTAMYRAA